MYNTIYIKKIGCFIINSLFFKNFVHDIILSSPFSTRKINFNRKAREVKIYKSPAYLLKKGTGMHQRFYLVLLRVLPFISIQLLPRCWELLNVHGTNSPR